MQSFLARHRDSITGVLSGFDRVVFRGVLRQLSHCSGLDKFLGHRRVLLRDFGDFVQALTDRVVAGCEAVARAVGRPVVYLPSSRSRKEDVTRDLLAKSPIDQGLICVLKCVEPCQSFEIHRSRERRLLELRSVPRKCAHFYHYYLHPQFGFMHVRTQSWMPFLVQVVINGREWLARDLERAGISHDRRDNCIASVAHPDKAQELLDQQLRTNWTEELDKLALASNPAHADIFHGDHMPRYWTTYQLEWATDVMFDSPASLAALYPDLALHAIRNLGSRDVLRFLQKKLTGHFRGDVQGSFKERPEGVRVKHYVDSNSIKMYDKQERVLRVETTLNRVRDIRTFRPREGDPGGERSWRPCRKGIADLHRATRVCQNANEAYLDAIAAVDTTTKLGEILENIVRPARLKSRRVRGLRPWDSSDLELLKAVGLGEHLLHGFRNRDIVRQLYPRQLTHKDARRAAARVGRLIRLLRAHKLVRKLPHTHRYRVTTAGRRVIAAILAAHNARLNSLLQAA